MNKYNNLYEQLERMTELINYNDGSFNQEENPYILYEGLIRTASLDYSRVLLKRWFMSLSKKKNSKILGNITAYLSPNIKITDDDTLIVDLLPLEDNINWSKDFLVYINNLGYYIGIITFKELGDKTETKYEFDDNIYFSLIKQSNNLEQFDVELEAKFDIEIDEKDWPDKLYHVTRQDVLHKIKKIGLAPRTELKLSKHPERVYFGKNYKKTMELIPLFKNQAELRGKGDQKYAFLEIDPKKVKHLRLFDDPNYKGYGYYGLVNAPPNAIKVLKENL